LFGSVRQIKLAIRQLLRARKYPPSFIVYRFTMVRRWRIVRNILRPVISASRVQHVSDLHRILNSHEGHTMRGSMVDIESPTAEIRRGKKKKEEKRRNHRTKI